MKLLPDMKKFSLISLGCPKNAADSEKVVNLLIQNGFVLVNENSSEEILVINTCAFIKDAVNEAKAVIKEAIKRKKKNQVAFIIVIGCLASRFKKEDLASEFSEVDLWLAPKEEDKIVETINQCINARNNASASEISSVKNVYTKITPFYYAYLKISEGCNNFCSYCTIPKIRGTYKSFSVDDILSTAQNYLRMGVKELILVAEDTTIWGIDFYQKPALNILLENLVKLPDLPWIRIMYAYPQHVTDDLIQTIKKYPQICNYLDLPVQHISDQILAGMNRKYSKKQLQNLLTDLKREIPDLALRTSLIVGFPEETDAEFNELLDFVEEYQFDHLGCFPFSKEQDTKAGSMLGQVKPRIAQERIKKIMLKTQKIKESQNQKLVGRTFDAIYEGNQIARSYREAPDIDSIIFLPESQDLIRGNFYKVQITDFDEYDLVGEVQDF